MPSYGSVVYPSHKSSSESQCLARPGSAGGEAAPGTPAARLLGFHEVNGGSLTFASASKQNRHHLKQWVSALAAGWTHLRSFNG